MINGRCPICSKQFQAQALADMPWFPFCSERCRVIDLGRWLGGDYAIPGPPVEIKPPPEANGSTDHDED